MLNRAIIMGRLTADPELRQTPNNISVSSFSVAVDRAYKSAGADRQTDFINVVAWRQTAEFVSRYFKKGQMIAVDGSIQTRSYTDKSGNKRTAFEIVADNISFCGSKESGSSSPNAGGFEAPPMPTAFENGNTDDFSVVDGNEDLPF